MDARKSIDDQHIDAEEKLRLIDWLERIADGRLVVRVPAEAFGLKLGANCDRAQARALCEKVKAKPAAVLIQP